VEGLRKVTKILTHDSQGVGMVIGCELDGRGSIPDKGKFRPALRPI
jgi:hypothetical protein